MDLLFLMFSLVVEVRLINDKWLLIVLILFMIILLWILILLVLETFHDILWLDEYLGDIADVECDVIAVGEWLTNNLVLRNLWINLSYGFIGCVIDANRTISHIHWLFIIKWCKGKHAAAIPLDEQILRWGEELMLHDMKGESLPENDLLKTLASNVVSHKDVEAEGLALVPVIIVNRF